MMRRAAPELMITITVTPNEAIAVNGAITAYRRYLERIDRASTVPEMMALLERFQQRLAQWVPPQSPFSTERQGR